MESFLQPYGQWLIAAAYNVQQSLEGFGLASSNFIEQDADGTIIGSYWSPLQAAFFPFVALLLYAIVLIPLIMLAAYILGRKKGMMVSVSILLLPGIASALGWLPAFNFLPRVFSIGGTGTLGSGLGILPLLMLGMITGWCLVVIVYDNFKLTDRFRHCYDHAWFLIAILAGIFFASDSGSMQESKQLEEASQQTRAASLYLLTQVRQYDEHCRQEGLTATASCQWASTVQQQLNDYAASHTKGFQTFGPRSSDDVYSPIAAKVSPEVILQIRQEIKLYNNEKCPIVRLSDSVSRLAPASTVCQSVPAAYCMAPPELLDGSIDGYAGLNSVALSSEGVAPSLVMLRKRQETLGSVVAQNEKLKHFRWLSFILLSVVVGGKIANSTTRAIDMDKRPLNERKRLVGLFKATGRGLTRWVTRLLVGFGTLVAFIYRSAGKQFALRRKS